MNDIKKPEKKNVQLTSHKGCLNTKDSEKGYNEALDECFAWFRQELKNAVIPNAEKDITIKCGLSREKYADAEIKRLKEEVKSAVKTNCMRHGRIIELKKQLDTYKKKIEGLREKHKKFEDKASLDYGLTCEVLNAVEQAIA